jgi:hypothetical protein
VAGRSPLPVTQQEARQMPNGLAPVKRDNGQLYRPRKVTAYAISDRDGDFLSGVVVLGTHDIDRATTLAQDFVKSQLGAGYAPVLAGCGWWRDGFESGQHVWLTDFERGRAGVMFARIEEAPTTGGTP